jgi:hypothetical protein
MILFLHSTSICVEQIDIYPPQNKQTKSNIKQSQKQATRTTKNTLKQFKNCKTILYSPILKTMMSPP